MARDLPAEQTDRVRRWLERVVERHGLQSKDLVAVTGVSGDTLTRLFHEPGNPRRTKKMSKATVNKIADGFGIGRGDLLAHAEGRRELPIPDRVPHPAAEVMDPQVQAIREEVTELRRTVDRVVRLLEDRGVFP